MNKRSKSNKTKGMNICIVKIKVKTPGIENK